MSKTTIISIDGNIGSGKSTLYKDLQRFYSTNSKIYFVPEPVDEWSHIKDKKGVPILTNLYKNTEKYAFRFQMMAYISRLSLLRKVVKSHNYDIIITERCVYTDKNVFAQMLYDDNKIEHDEFQIYLNWFEEFLDELKIAGIVYVKADPEICNYRVKKRSREGETIPLSYLTSCHNYHERWINNEKIPILTIDANHDTSAEENNNLRNIWLNKINNWIFMKLLKDELYSISNENDKNSDSITIRNEKSHFVLQFDGACRGNPSNELGVGYILFNENDEIIQANKKKFLINNGTNNVAEYIALIEGLKLAINKNINNLIVEGDSELLINQMNGKYKVKSNNLIIHFNEAQRLSKMINNIGFYHIRREFNKKADHLANQAFKQQHSNIIDYSA